MGFLLSPFYSIFIGLYILVLHIAALFNVRARKLIQGHVQNRAFLHSLRKNAGKEQRIWFHVSSLGEFEQARPMMMKIRKYHPNYKIVTTFFSPSGYDLRKEDPISDYTGYLPFDLPWNAYRTVQAIQPKAAFWVKYDLWYFYLKTLHRKNMPIYLIDAALQPNAFALSYFGGFYRIMLRTFTIIFTQNEETKTLLQSISIQSIVAGDTRFDRVSQPLASLHEIAQWVQTHPVLVAGSTYDIDEHNLVEIHKEFPTLKIIIAPHHVDENHLQRIERRFSNKIIRYNALLKNPSNDFPVVLIDRIGLLSQLYAYGHMAYVGGGFKKGGLHNILESAVCGIPVVFGPETGKFPEAEALMKAGGAVRIKNKYEWVYQTRIWMENPAIRKQAGDKAAQFIQHQQGATKRIFDEISL